jgi:hypothetical protein
LHSLGLYFVFELSNISKSLVERYVGGLLHVHSSTNKVNIELSAMMNTIGSVYVHVIQCGRRECRILYTVQAHKMPPIRLRSTTLAPRGTSEIIRIGIITSTTPRFSQQDAAPNKCTCTLDNHDGLCVPTLYAWWHISPNFQYKANNRHIACRMKTGLLSTEHARNVGNIRTPSSGWTTPVSMANSY